MYIMLMNPVTLEPERRDIKRITKVYPDGSFNVDAGDVKGRVSCTVYDDEGRAIAPAANMTPEDFVLQENDTLHQQLLETQAALATMYETLAAMIEEGGV